MTENISTQALLSLYALSGIDEAVGDTPVNRFDVPAATAPEPQPQMQTEPQPAVHVPAQAAAQSVDSGVSLAVKNIQSLAELKEKMDRFDGCSLRKTAQNMVFADGNPKAELMIIGEAPGAEEDKQGLPFVGASGHLLDAMLGSIGLNRDSVYITNVIAWRPPMNRKPSEAEIAACLPFLRRHIALVKPKVLLLLGGIALTSLMHMTDGITKTRGYWLNYEGDEGEAPIPTMASFHPAYLLRSPAQKKNAWRDFQNIRDKLNTP